jgi:hypothetical protein
MGAAEVEVVRRLNLAVGSRLNTEQRRFVVEQGLRPRLAVAVRRPLVLPTEHLPWARSYAEGLIDELQRRGVEVVGDLADLLPEDRNGPGVLDEVSDDALLEATQAALAALAIGHGRLFRRYRRAFHEREGRFPTPLEVVGSGTRAAGFGVQKAALRLTAHNRLLARAARAYVTRTAGRRGN